MTEIISSHSHGAEDILLHRTLQGVEAGFYIDIGAFDPVEESITKIFYDAGWNGINLEPNPDAFARLQELRPRDINLDIAVSDTEGTLTLNLLRDTGLTTLVKDIAETHADKGWDVEALEVQTRRLADIWHAHVPAGQEVHFLKIDVEGAEEAVIRSADWTRHRPWIVVAEAVVPLSTEQNHHAWDPLLLEAGYQFAYFDGLNRYYVAEEKSELAERFFPPLNVAIDQYTPNSTRQALAEVERHRQVLNDLSAHCRAVEQRYEVVSDLMKRRPRPWWEMLVFDRTGTPKKIFRRILFHTSGAPRGMFRNWVMQDDAVPHLVFYTWMCSEAYQALPKAVRIKGALNGGAE
ncbi:FkbM family methyltransferase [Ruegeria sp. HKCCD6228]|uniref:FkbM family methyltransferase n=1 Tax=unclassified Ruegeria TaxID=2625375 RepID=UPI00148980C8|nr:MULTISPECIES: FkbM family methyltransferase [unclassified Ruegeria]NOD99480.1 FkbM family methyltransferase [Ruegeria sp. HKCCD6228]